MRINLKDEKKLQTAIDSVQTKKMSARTIDIDDIRYAVKQVEKRLGTLLPKRHWQGLRFFVDPHAQTFPSAYRGIPESTQFTLEHGANAWFLIDIRRARCSGPTSHISPQNMATKQAEILAFVSSHF